MDKVIYIREKNNNYRSNEKPFHVFNFQKSCILDMKCKAQISSSIFHVTVKVFLSEPL